MVAKLMLLRPHSLSLTHFLSHPCSFFIKLYPYSLTFPSSFSTASTISTCSAIPYGPSLQKGHKKPSSQQHYRNLDHKLQQYPFADGTNAYTFDEDDFSRVYDIAGLRVPSDQCFALESRLRGHLLNWPRIRNIVRVPGDEIEDEFKKFVSDSNLNDDDSSDSLVSLNRRIYGKAEGDGERLSPVLYRDKLVRTFNVRGFVNFRKLAKLSRPKKRRKKEEDNREKKKGIGRNELYMVELEEEELEEGEDLRGLLGDDFKGRRKWKGSTRLLLLDEQYANQTLDKMPEAIKAAFADGQSQSMNSDIELVRCKLTLFYTYWQMNEILEALLPKGLIVPSAFESVGHIAHLNLRDEHLPYKKLIAKVVLDKHKPKIEAVVNKIDAIHNDYRTMQLEVLAGTESLITTVVENGLRFHFDLATVYWNSRLATERQRLVNCFTESDIVCDVFAGVGPIAIAAARRVKHVYANDLNPHAVDFLQRNCVLNKLERKIEVFNMDGRRFIDAVFATSKSRSITQVVMNLPNDAAEYLDAFKGLFRNSSADRGLTLPKIHVYGFSKARDPEFDFQERIRIALSAAAFEIEMHRVRLVAPGKWMLCASFILPARVACANEV